jgi:hypothetical protein
MNFIQKVAVAFSNLCVGVVMMSVLLASLALAWIDTMPRWPNARLELPRVEFPYTPSNFTFEQTAVSDVQFGTITVAYVMHNNTDKAFSFLIVTCSLYKGDKLVGSVSSAENNIGPRTKINGQAFGAYNDDGPRPERSECSASPV